MQIVQVSSVAKMATEAFNRVSRNGWIILERLIEPIMTSRRGCIVEIGMGASTQMFAKAAQRYGVKLHSCDKSVLKAGQPYHKGHTVFIGTSFDFMKQFKDTPSIVLIDGCHDYAVVKKEFEFFLDKLIEGGVIWLHDTAPFKEELLESNACSDSWKLRQEIERRTDVDCLTWLYTGIGMGLTMVLKRETNPPYWRESGR